MVWCKWYILYTEPFRQNECDRQMETDILIANVMIPYSVWPIKLKLQNKPRRWLNAATWCATKEGSRKTRRSRLWTASSRQHLTRYQTLRYHFCGPDSTHSNLLTLSRMSRLTVSCTQSKSNVFKHQTQHFDKCIERQMYCCTGGATNIHSKHSNAASLTKKMWKITSYFDDMTQLLQVAAAVSTYQFHQHWMKKLNRCIAAHH